MILPRLLMLIALLALAGPDPTGAEGHIEIAAIAASPDDYHLRQVTLQGRVHQVRQLDPYFQPSGTACSGAYVFTLEDETGYLPIAVLGICGMPIARSTEVSEGDRIVLRAVIHAPGRFGSFYGPTGLRTPGGGPAPLHAVASAIQRGTE